MIDIGRVRSVHPAGGQRKRVSPSMYNIFIVNAAHVMCERGGVSGVMYRKRRVSFYWPLSGYEVVSGHGMVCRHTELGEDSGTFHRYKAAKNSIIWTSLSLCIIITEDCTKLNHLGRTGRLAGTPF